MQENVVWSFSNPEQRVQWSYNRWFNAYIKKRTRYSFVRLQWDREIGEMITLERLQDEPHDPVYVPLDDSNRATLEAIHKAGMVKLMEFLDRVTTQEKAEAICLKSNIKPAEDINLLRKIYKYLPAGAQIRQLVAKEDTTTHQYIDILVKYKLGFSLAFLDIARTPSGRCQLADLTGIPFEGLMDLVRRSDMTRLGLMSGGMVRQSWALGFKGLAAFEDVAPEAYYASCEGYYRKAGKGMPFDFTMKNVVSHITRMREASTLIEE